MPEPVSPQPISHSGRPPSGPKRIQSVDRAMALLKLVAHSREPLAIGELATVTGLNRSTAWRLLMTLEHHGLVDRDPLTQGYVSGYELLRMAEAKPAREFLSARARGTIDRLSRKTGETVNLLIPTALGILSIDQREAPKVASVNIVGIRLPLHATASGKLRLAYADQAELPQLLEGIREPFTDRTLTDPDSLRSELERVRRQGYALERDEFEPGVSGVSAPVFNERGDAVAFVSIWGLTARLTNARLRDLATDVRAAADEVTSLLRAPRVAASG